MTGLEELELIYIAKVATLKDMKARGDLTKDWGECSLICAEGTLKEIRQVMAAGDQK